MKPIWLAATTVACCLLAPPAAFSATLDWEVADRFRLFLSEPAPTRIVEDPGLSVQDVFLAKVSASPPGPAARPEEPVYRTIATFLGRAASGRGPMAGKRPYQATHWVGAGPDAESTPSRDRRYSSDYLYPAGYTVRVRAKGVAPGDTCTWRVASLGDDFTAPCAVAVLLPVRARPDHRGAVATEVGLDVRSPSGQATQASATISFPDRLIVGLGESFASGEGNPDEPQRYDPRLRKAMETYWSEDLDPHERWWRSAAVLESLTPARWWDPVCHRSLYSQQAAAAFVYSASRPREAVTFAAFSCSGAEVLDGLLAPQANPPGVSDYGRPGADKTFAMRAQVNDLVALLCRNEPAADLSRRQLSGLARAGRITRERLPVVINEAVYAEVRCAQGTPRPVDAVLLSIGGNDVGFAGAVKNALLPTLAADRLGQSVLSRVRSLMQITPAYIAHRRILYDLPQLYPEVQAALRATVAPGLTPVIQSQYPNALEDQGPAPPQGKSFCDGPNDNRLFGAMHGIFPDAKVDPAKRWRLEITAAEGREVNDALFEPLNLAVRSSQGPGWNVIGYDGAFDRRGWCAGDLKERMEYDLPGLRADGSWVSFNPETWDPYASRTRLFRTANDVVLTQIGSTKPLTKLFSDLGNRSFFATAGMFHPTAQGHTIIGLAAAEELRRQLPPAP